jgi:glycosyltransferase involved in cell wall biosynthesis
VPSGTIVHAVRILHVVGQSHRRGAETFALELASELDALGHANRVVAIGVAFDGQRDEDLPALTERKGLGPLGIVTGGLRLKRLLARDPFDFALAHGGSAAQALVLARRARPPLLVWQRILGFPAKIWGPVHQRWWRLITHRLDAVVALTRTLEEETRRLGFTGPVWKIGNTRAPERFISVDRHRASAKLRREMGLHHDVALMGFVGHLVEQKRPERALDVLSFLLAQGQSAHLVFAGDGPLRTELESDIRSRDLGRHVTLLGHRSDIEQVYGAIDLLLITSDDEGIPGVALEAQMAGCPVVTFRLGGVDSVVEHGRTGFVLDPSDTRLMGWETIRLLEQPGLRAQFGNAARGAAERFSAAEAAIEYDVHLRALHERFVTLR